MPKFEIELEITGFKMKIKGEREDIPVIASNIRNQMGQFVQPAANITQGQIEVKPLEPVIQPIVESNGKAKKVTRRPRNPACCRGDIAHQRLAA